MTDRRFGSDKINVSDGNAQFGRSENLLEILGIGMEIILEVE